ncbi:MAG TPA: hypothetical protein VNA24_25350 [Hyalangium sp.]|nr:hypothetical protein [Hyalangium sp.]
MSAIKRLLVGLSICLGVAAVSVPTGVNAYKRWRDARERRLFHGPRERAWNDPLERSRAWRQRQGPRTPELTARWLAIAQEEARKWSHLTPVQGLSWVNLGPTDARFQYDGALYPQVDSGRVTGIAVNPASADTVYIATAGGGIWKTFNFSASPPRWLPITETLGNLAIGALAMDPQAPETLYAGLGDPFEVPGGQLVKTVDGGASWSAPVALAGAYDQDGSPFPVQALSFRSLAVDPINPDIVLAGTDVGLFRSTDAGQSFTLVDLPNADLPVAEAIWSIVHLGQVGGVSRWALSGVQAAAPGMLPPLAGTGDPTTPGDIWLSTDAGATWSSRKAAGRLPDVPTGRITLAAGTPSADPVPRTVIYAQAAADTEFSAAGYWRSTDSGDTFVDITGDGTVHNPTLPPDLEQSDCVDVYVAGGQSWYNAAIAVDPTNDAHVIIGGLSCGLRTLNGLADSPVWENISHALPPSGRGDTAHGRLPYVHSGWQKITIVRTGDSSLIIAGTNGGLFVSRDVFNPSPVSDQTVTWSDTNRGIVSHQFYSVASGDPATGDAFVAYGGLQDNGTRFRDTAAGAAPTTFNQVIGGDGIAATISRAPSDTVYWASTPYVPRYCDPDTSDCNRGESWSFDSPVVDGELACPFDFPPYFTSVADIRVTSTEPAVLHTTDQGVYRLIGDPSQRQSEGRVWQLLGDLTVTDGSGACSGELLHQIVMASQNVDGLYGATLSDGRFRVTANCPLAANPTTCTWQLSTPLGVDLDSSGSITPDESLSFSSGLDFPPGPTGSPAGMVYVASSAAPVTLEGAPVPEALGHLFRTVDGGATWQPLKGNGTGQDLPNVPIRVVRYDPGDNTNATLYVGTDLGVYRTTDAGNTWERFGSGMPMVQVTDLFISQSGALMRAATFGRGLWEIYPTATAPKGVPGTGDWDRNQQLDFVDLLSTANRLGTTPATSSQPLYDWNQDLTGTVNGIDDADLEQLLSGFGGRP